MCQQSASESELVSYNFLFAGIKKHRDWYLACKNDWRWSATISEYYYKLNTSEGKNGGDGGGATRPLPRDVGVEKFREDPTSGPGIKYGSSTTSRWRAGEAQMQDNTEGGELDPTVDNRRR